MRDIDEEIEISNGAWIDYQKDSNGDFIWYAILCPEQYTKGHTLMISGKKNPCIRGKFDKRVSDIEPFLSGINRISNNLKEKHPNIQNVYILGLCEDLNHFHVHLIPRYPYKPKDIEFHVKNYWKREGYSNEEELRNDWQNPNIKNKFHGSWYITFKEINYVNRSYWKKEPKVRAQNLHKLAEKLRNPNLPYPF